MKSISAMVAGNALPSRQPQKSGQQLSAKAAELHLAHQLSRLRSSQKAVEKAKQDLYRAVVGSGNSGNANKALALVATAAGELCGVGAVVADGGGVAGAGETASLGGGIGQGNAADAVSRRSAPAFVTDGILASGTMHGMSSAGGGGAIASTGARPHTREVLPSLSPDALPRVCALGEDHITSSSGGGRTRFDKAATAELVAGADPSTSSAEDRRILNECESSQMRSPVSDVIGLHEMIDETREVMKPDEDAGVMGGGSPGVDAAPSPMTTVTVATSKAAPAATMQAALPHAVSCFAPSPAPLTAAAPAVAPKAPSTAASRPNTTVVVASGVVLQPSAVSLVNATTAPALAMARVKAVAPNPTPVTPDVWQAPAARPKPQTAMTNVLMSRTIPLPSMLRQAQAPANVSGRATSLGPSAAGSGDQQTRTQPHPSAVGMAKVRPKKRQVSKIIPNGYRLVNIKAERELFKHIYGHALRCARRGSKLQVLSNSKCGWSLEDKLRCSGCKKELQYYPSTLTRTSVVLEGHQYS